MFCVLVQNWLHEVKSYFKLPTSRLWYQKNYLIFFHNFIIIFLYIFLFAQIIFLFIKQKKIYNKAKNVIISNKRNEITLIFVRLATNSKKAKTNVTWRHKDDIRLNYNPNIIKRDINPLESNKPIEK